MLNLLCVNFYRPVNYSQKPRAADQGGQLLAEREAAKAVRVLGADCGLAEDER